MKTRLVLYVGWPVLVAILGAMAPLMNLAYAEEPTVTVTLLDEQPQIPTDDAQTSTPDISGNGAGTDGTIGEPWTPELELQGRFAKAVTFWGHTGPMKIYVFVVPQDDINPITGLPQTIAFTIRTLGNVCFVYFLPTFWLDYGDLDQQMIVNHEFGHCLGNGHTDDPRSVMYPYFTPGKNDLIITAWDKKLYELHWAPKSRLFTFVSADTVTH